MGHGLVFCPSPAAAAVVNSRAAVAASAVAALFGACLQQDGCADQALNRQTSVALHLVKVNIFQSILRCLIRRF